MSEQFANCPGASGESWAASAFGVPMGIPGTSDYSPSHSSATDWGASTPSYSESVMSEMHAASCASAPSAASVPSAPRVIYDSRGEVLCYPSGCYAVVDFPELRYEPIRNLPDYVPASMRAPVIPFRTDFQKQCDECFARHLQRTFGRVDEDPRAHQ